MGEKSCWNCSVKLLWEFDTQGNPINWPDACDVCHPQGTPSYWTQRTALFEPKSRPEVEKP